MLISGRCHVRHTHVNRPHAYGIANTLVDASQDIKALRYDYTRATTDTTQQSGQTSDKEIDINHVTVLCQRLHGNRPAWHVVFQQLLTGPTKLFVTSRESGHTLAAVCIVSNLGAMDKPYLIELARDMPPLWDQREKNYHKRDLKPY